jgi:type I restriction enzyme R subunit
MQDIRDIVEAKLARMLAQNPLRMDYYRRYQEIIADYNREKDRATVEATFAALLDLVASLDEEQQHAADESLDEAELALFDLIRDDSMTRADRERVKQASKHLLESIRRVLAAMPRWTETAATQAEIRTTILDDLWSTLPQPPFDEQRIEEVSSRVYSYVWGRSAGADGRPYG